MPIDAKPLFRPDVLASHLRSFEMPAPLDDARASLERWSKLIHSGQADKLGEREILPDWMSDLFVKLLGYESPPGTDGRYTFSRERHVEADGQFADGVLGRLTPDRSEFVAVIEGKGPRDPLDRPHAGRRLSAVEQGYRYAVNLPSDWIIITSVRQTRLYFKNADQHTYERFDTERLADDEALLRKLVFLLGASRVVPADGRRCHLYDLRDESERAGRELTRKYYLDYAEMRQRAFEQLRDANADVPAGEVLTATQRLLDRVLFCAFAEDRGLLPADSLRRAFRHADPYNPRPIWDNFRGLFRAVDEGRESLQIPRYNGGLFARDALLDKRLTVSDDVCRRFAQLGEFEYRQAIDVPAGASDAAALRPQVDVEILGHIFEQSISDLERIRSTIDGTPAEDAPKPKAAKSRRKREGAFYTPAFITRYIIEQTLGGVLEERFETLRERHHAGAAKGVKAALADPRTYDLKTLKKGDRDALIAFWLDWQDVLGKVRIVDPACGSGAFLVEAFDQLYAHYTTANDHLADLRGQPELFDLDKRILQQNLFGVDLNDEAIEICRLSLWIKTAQRGKTLTALDATIRAGNSVVSDPAVSDRAFDWHQTFPEVFADGGFDVVVGNPPYVRQELLGPIKPHLEAHFASYHGMADLYVYFYELGLRLLRPGGKLSLVVTNKWLKAGYAEPLRKHLAEASWAESLVDFGHAKQIFEDADVFPCILVAQKPVEGRVPPKPRVCAIPREQLRVDDLSKQVEDSGRETRPSALGSAPWELDAGAAAGLLDRIRGGRETLYEFARVHPRRGILTGFNAAFLVDGPTRDALIAAEPACAPLIRQYLRGQDIDRHSASWAGLWMIAIKSSDNTAWPWSDAQSVEEGERLFQASHPALHAHLRPFEAQLKKRQDRGRFWWELRSCAYWAEFDGPKLFYQVIQYHCRYAFDHSGMLGNDKTYFLPSADRWIQAVLNSPLMWWHNWRALTHLKDEALSPMAYMVERLPIARPTDRQRVEAEGATRRLIDITQQRQAATRVVVDWLKVEMELEKLSLKLQQPLELDADAFVAEVKKARGKKKPLTAAGLQALRAEHAASVVPARSLAGEMLTLERRLSDLVNAAYGLTPEEVQLMWDTAPPRMPFLPPSTAAN